MGLIKTDVILTHWLSHLISDFSGNYPLGSSKIGLPLFIGKNVGILRPQFLWVCSSVWNNFSPEIPWLCSRITLLGRIFYATPCKIALTSNSQFLFAFFYFFSLENASPVYHLHIYVVYFLFSLKFNPDEIMIFAYFVPCVCLAHRL